MKKSLLFIFLLVLVSSVLFAQCPMCGEAARTSLSEGNNAAKGLNAGILFLLMGPYVLVIIGGIIWYKARKKAHRQAATHFINN